MSHTATYKYSCSYCGTDDAVLNLDHPYDDVCADCDGICEKTALCETCKTGPAYDGVDECLSCVASACVKDPTLIGEYTRPMQVAIADELARRLRPKLSVRQAA
jgi:hypothetical protein